MKIKWTLIFSLILTGIIFTSCKKDKDILDPDTPLYTWSYYSKANGLSSDSINFIFEDNNNNIWVATHTGGVCKFNGSNWVRYNQSDGLLRNKVMSINQDKNGNLWFSTPSGFSVFDGVSSFYNIQKTSSDEWIYADKMIKDKRGWIWATDYFEMGFYLYDGYDIYYIDLGGAYTNVIALAMNPDGTIMLAYEGGVFIFYVDSKGKQQFDDYSNSNKLYASYTSSMCFDSRGSVWFGHQAADRVTRLTGTRAEYINLYNGWSDTNVSSILEDNKQNIWFTLRQGGVIKYNGIEPKVFGVNSGLSDDDITCSLIDHSGNIWFGTKKSGICIYKPSI